MFKRILLWFLAPVYEVRRINVKTGRDVPGTKLYAGDDYREAREVFDNAKLKYGFMVRLQAVHCFDYRINDSTPEVATIVHAEIDNPQFQGHEQILVTITDEASDVDPSVYKRDIPASLMDAATVTVDPADSDDFVETRIEGTFPTAEGHACNFSGPMIYNQEKGRYNPTCSICGEPRP